MRHLTLDDASAHPPPSSPSFSSITCCSLAMALCSGHGYHLRLLLVLFTAMDDWIAELEGQYAERLQLADRGHPGVASQVPTLYSLDSFHLS